MTWRALPRRLLPLALLLLALWVPSARADADDDLEDLLDAWETLVERKGREDGEAERRVLEQIADLGTRRSQRALKMLRNDADRDAWRRTTLILAAMARHASPKEIDELVKWAEGRKDAFLIENLGEVLSGAQEPEAVLHLQGKGLAKAKPAVKAQIARALGLQGQRGAVPALLGLLDEKHAEVRVEALRALGMVGDEQVVESVLGRLHDKDDRVRDTAALALGSLGARLAGEALVEALRDECPRVVESAALALGTLGDPVRIPDLIERLHETADVDERVAHACAMALEKITGKVIGMDPDRWTDWWDAVKDRPFERAKAEEEPPEGRTVPANRYYGFPIYSSRVVFVLDVSKSMQESKRLENAQAELIQAIEHLPCSTKFNIVIFSDGANAWEKELMEANARAIRDAVKFVRRQRPQNQTNTWAALQKAMEDEEVDTIFFLSDGQPSVGAISDADRILAGMRAANRYRRVHVHCVALLTGGKDASHGEAEEMRKAESFMRTLAADHDGEFKAVK